MVCCAACCVLCVVFCFPLPHLPASFFPRLLFGFVKWLSMFSIPALITVTAFTCCTLSSATCLLKIDTSRLLATKAQSKLSDAARTSFAMSILAPSLRSNPECPVAYNSLLFISSISQQPFQTAHKSPPYQPSPASTLISPLNARQIV